MPSTAGYARPDAVRLAAQVLDNGEVMWPAERATTAIRALADAKRVVLGLDVRDYRPDGSFVESLTATILFAVFLAVAIVVVKSGNWEATLRERARIMQSSGIRPDTGTQRRIGRLMVALIVVGLVASAAALVACHVSGGR
jgi:hypothetical protein